MPDSVPSLKTSLAHLRRYGNRYSVEALVEQLRQLGAGEEVLAQAVQLYGQGEARPWWKARFWVVVWVLLLLLALAVLAVGVCISVIVLSEHK